MMPRCFKTIGVAGCFLSLFCMLGGHWFAIQSVAWARMLAEFSRTDSLREAVEKTLDGKHPCKMCLAIREGRQQEERGQKNVPLVKTEKAPEFFCNHGTVEVPSPPMQARNAVALVPHLHADFIGSPPSPPPRNLAVL